MGARCLFRGEWRETEASMIASGEERRERLNLHDTRVGESREAP
jgi:hypothetical protein